MVEVYQLIGLGLGLRVLQNYAVSGMWPIQAFALESTMKLIALHQLSYVH